jgi:hypothetical protein
VKDPVETARQVFQPSAVLTELFEESIGEKGTSTRKPLEDELEVLLRWKLQP